MLHTSKTLPDITTQSSPDAASLKWVGMEKIGLPLSVELADGKQVAVTASVDVFVSLDTSAKGIHMSRLYLLLTQKLANQTLSFNSVAAVLQSILDSHTGISNGTKICFSFDLPLLKPALLSEHYGYQAYPVSFSQQIVNGVGQTSISLTIPYSSTCPCSASLANQLNAETIAEQFAGETIDKQALMQWLTNKQTRLATPHNQRSYAYITMQLAHPQSVQLDTLIFQCEDAIGTPVQTAVKREDEQAFARLNGDNLLFCEDAARRLKRLLNGLDKVQDYHFKVEHQESLHAHNAVVIDQKYPSGS